MNEKLLKLQRDMIANPPKFVVQRNKLLSGDFVQIQKYIIDNARKYAKNKGATKRDSVRAWVFFEFLEQYDTDAESSRRTLESMIENTNGGNCHTASEFLNYVSFLITSELRDKWNLLGNWHGPAVPTKFDPITAGEAAKREREKRKKSAC